MITSRTLAAALLLMLPLVACKQAEPPKQAQAGGEVLPGSLSDAMLPLDTVTSQPPLAPKLDKVEGKAAPSASGGAADNVPAPDAPAEPAEPAG